VLKTRTITDHFEGIPIPLSVTQLLYRTTNGLGKPTVNVTSVVKSPTATPGHGVIAYGSFYDSLNPADSPSYSFAGGTSVGQTIGNVETGIVLPFLLQGYDVIIADTEGETADFASGPEYGRTTLDSIRAASNSSATGISPTAKVGLIGYSGGAIATGWAAALAPTYAPDVNRRIVGATEGGVLVDPDHNLHYIQGSLVWAGVLVMALIGASRAADVDLTPYLSSYGRSLVAKLKYASIATVLGAYPGLTWKKIAKPQYAQPEDVAPFVKVVNKLDLGSYGTPTVPMFIGQGANGILEGTSGTTKGVGAGDGVMVAGDVRSLARQYCSHGAKILYKQYNATSHVTTVPLWLPTAISWLADRFAGKTVPTSCGSIPVGNPLTPIKD
jgi:hypothetical protein